MAIETSSEACSVAICFDGETREKFQHAPMRHAELLLPAIQSLLAEAALPLAGLDAIAFGRGPGSFTSLRIGIGVAQGLAWGADLPVVPVSSLAAVAQEAADLIHGESRRILVALDARMQEVYSCSFLPDERGLVRAGGEEVVCSPGALAIAGDESFLAVGNGFERFAELESLAGRAEHFYPAIWPRAAMISKLAQDWLNANDALPAAMAQPVYIRNKVAEKPTSRSR